MRHERALRRPLFREGLALRLADGQVWSLPLPDETAVDPGGPKATWDGPIYRAILRAVVDAEDEGELFRAELVLAIHLIKWNYAVDRNDLGEMLGDQGDERAQAELSNVLHELALAHVGPIAGQAEADCSHDFGALGSDASRLIKVVAAQVIGRRRGREATGPADLRL